MMNEPRGSSRAWEQALSLFAEASAAQKCRACGCFHALLRALATDRRLNSWPEELVEAVTQAQECLTEVQYDCFGCEVCLPPLIVTALSQAIGDDLGELDLCPGEQVAARPGWPPLPGSYIVRRFCAPVAVCSLMAETLAQTLAREAGPELSLVGTLATENLGIERVIHNVLANPHIRYLILCGPDSQQEVGHFPGQSLLALAQNGLDRRGRILGARGRRPVVKTISRDAVEHFRQTVTVVDLIGTSEVAPILTMIEACAAQNPGPAVAFPSTNLPDSIPGYLPKRMVADPAGYFVVYADRPRGLLSLEHYRNDGVLDAVIEGRTAAELYTPAIDKGLILRLDHAAYLGRELSRAEDSLRTGEAYVQDAAPEQSPKITQTPGSCGSSCRDPDT
jgi:tetrahydromethanopterin S-methyltransferase subunit A